MPTARPRHQITETPPVAQAIDLAARRWPGESRSKLLLRLVDAGSAVVEKRIALATAERRQAIESSSGKYPTAFDANFLVELRRDWSE